MAKNDVQCFKDIPEVAWQIIDLPKKPTTIILDKPRNVAPNLVSGQLIGNPHCKEPFASN
jgi:L-threonylcarbamoyladenylate synthase